MDGNTQYVLSLSYGKDSMASIHVIKDVLNWPLDRIITADVWATDAISANLPPMEEFKHYADKIIKERWGIDVEHVCAMRKVKQDSNSQTVQVEREREREQLEKVTFEKLFYTIPKRKNPVRENPMKFAGGWKRENSSQNLDQSTDGRQEWSVGATASSKFPVCNGWPGTVKAQWCKKLKPADKRFF